MVAAKELIRDKKDGEEDEDGDVDVDVQEEEDMGDEGGGEGGPCLNHRGQRLRKRRRGGRQRRKESREKRRISFGETFGCYHFYLILHPPLGPGPQMTLKGARPMRC